MAVFVCCADESEDQKPRLNFFYGGFAAPVDDWEGSFARAWNEHVLQGQPQLEYLHVSELMIPVCRQKLGISEFEAERRLDEAASVIHNQGSLIPIMWQFGVDRFDEIRRLVPRKLHSGLERPDYLAFLTFAFTTLKWLHAFRHDEVEKVDFWVEENDKVSVRVGRFHSRMVNTLTEIGAPELAALVGEFQEVSKKRIPAQAADILNWHARNNEAGKLTPRQGARYNKMVRQWLDRRDNRQGMITDGDWFLASMKQSVERQLKGDDEGDDD